MCDAQTKLRKEIYRDRCNDPEKRKAWEESGLVRLDSLKKGDVFENIDGDFLFVDRQAANGLIHSKGWGHDELTHMIPSALVRPVIRRTYDKISDIEFLGKNPTDDELTGRLLNDKKNKPRITSEGQGQLHKYVDPV